MRSWKTCTLAIASLVLGLWPMRRAGSMFVGDAAFRGHGAFVQEVAAPQYWEFFYAHTLYNPAQADPAHTLYRAAYYQQDLVRDWTAYLRHRVRAGDVYAFLYELAPADFSAYLDHHLSPTEKLALRPQIVGNELVQYATRPGHEELLHYLTVCKQVEALLGTYREQEAAWEEADEADDYQYRAVADTATAPPDPAVAALAQDLQARLQSTSDSFLQARYAYQWLVVCRYTHAYRQGVAIYEQHLRDALPTQELRYWAQHHAGYCYARLGQQARADLMQAQVFFRSTAKKRAAEVNFSGHDLGPVLALARTARDSAEVLALRELRNPAYVKAPLAQIYRLVGGAVPLQVLVAREIAKLEEFYPQGYFLSAPADTTRPTGNPLTGGATLFDPNRQADEQQLQRLVALTLTAANAPATTDHAAWDLMAAHLLFLANRYSEAAPYLDRALAAPTATPVQRLQARITRTLLLVRPGTALTPATRQALAAELDWLRQDNKLGRFEDVLDVVSEQLTRTPTDYGTGMLLPLMEYPRVILSGWAEDDPEGVVTPEDRLTFYRDYVTQQDLPALEAMAQAVTAPTPDPLTQLVLRTNPLVRDLVLDELGSKYLLADRLDPALAAFEQVAPAYWQQDVFRQYLDEDPTQVTYFRNHGTHPLPAARRYTKPQYVRRMLALRRAAGQPSPRQAQTCLALANMYFNLSQHGNSWIMVQRGIGGLGYSLIDHNVLTSTYFSSFLHPSWRRNPAWRRNYLELADARTWYQRAAATARSPQLAAACLLMACRCDYQGQRARAGLDLNQYEYYSDKDEASERDSRQSAFGPLYQRFPQYAEALTTNCATYDKFIGRALAGSPAGPGF